MGLKKRAMARLFLAWVLSAAGMAAVALSATPDAPGLVDVQIGERGNQTRIALLCVTPCNIEKRSNTEFVLHGVGADLSLDLSARSKFVSAFTAAPNGDSSLMRVNVNSAVEYANTKTCTVGGQAAACIDLFFAAGKTPGEVGGQRATRPAPAAYKDPPGNSAKPALREGAEERLNNYAQVMPPEHLKAPPVATLAKLQPAPGIVEVGKPAIRTRDPIRPAAGLNYAARVHSLLGKDLSAAYCNNAQATLQADPWALGAMVDVGLCTAARGEVAEAEEILTRLLEYTPDNYEAHVGRALIAVDAGEKSVARKYFQDALNTPPPIEESNRIVQAMNAL